MPDFINKNISPIRNQLFLWYGKYNLLSNKKDISEYDNDLKEYPFSIVQDNKEKIKEFGLLGNGTTISFDTKTGIFDLGTKKFYKFHLLDHLNKHLYLNGSNDIIQYKKAAYDYIPGSKFTSGFVQSHFIGFKSNITNFPNKDNILYYTIILEIPVDGHPMKFKVSLTSKNTDFDGKLCITEYKKTEKPESEKINIDSIDIKLIKNRSKEYEYIVV